MEKTVCFEPQEQASNVAVVTPNKGKLEKRTKKPPIIQPWAKITKTELEARIPTSKWIHLGCKEELEHLGYRWLRTVWWHKYEREWKPRDPSKPIIWACLPDW